MNSEDSATTIVKAVLPTPQIVRYVEQQVEPLSPAERNLIEATQRLGGPAEMQIPPHQGAFLTLLAKLVNAELAVDVGTFTGYSALCLARGLAPGGRVITCDITTEWSDIAQRAWLEVGVDDLIEQRLGRASDVIDDIAVNAGDRLIDIAFIDADKVSYIDYWQLLVPRMRPGGLLVADNVLYAGEAADPEATGNGLAIRRFNDHVHADDRVESVLLPVADGITVARKKEARG